jgi:hypothetical protein
MNDGDEMDVGPGDALRIPPGHDAWVVGDEPYVRRLHGRRRVRKGRVAAGPGVPTRTPGSSLHPSPSFTFIETPSFIETTCRRAPARDPLADGEPLARGDLSGASGRGSGIDEFADQGARGGDALWLAGHRRG